MIHVLKEMLFQDVKSENETKKASVILRLNSIVMCIYFLVLLCTFFITGDIKPIVLCVPLFCAYVASFYTTYLNRTKMSVIFVHVLMGFWIIAFIRGFGWDCGVQHFVFVLLALNFTTSYSKLCWKIAMGAALCLFRLALYAYTLQFEPLYMLEMRTYVIFQIVNTVFVFVATITILTIFTEDSQEMEKKLVMYNEKLHRLAAIDPLTGLLNRRSMLEYLGKKEAECKEGKNDSLSLALGDVDFFKRINDTYGHECGDIVLRRLASIFVENIGDKGRICRWGGEEFLFVFDNINGDEALIIMEELQKKIREMEVLYKGEPIKVTMTFGLGEFDFQMGMDYSINDVDVKLYQGKTSGRNKIVY
ncbi:MAG: GGDEF domain-containing protein [Clostridiales bacterium]|nr:GGDEF domain-containing protein [Clostridiales bacterium]